MIYLAQALAMIALTTSGADETSSAVCQPAPSVCGLVEGATRFYLDQNVVDMVIEVHDDADAAERFVAAATGFESR